MKSLNKNLLFSDYCHFACIRLQKYIIAILFAKVSISGTQKCHSWYVRSYRGTCWSGGGQECEKEAFSEYAGQVMAKDADGQDIVTKSLAK